MCVWSYNGETMRKPVLLIFTNACILIVVFLLLGQSLFIVQRVALTRTVSGQVTVQRSGQGAFVPILAGAGIKSGDVVQTGAHSTADFAWPDGTRWKMAPDSRLVIQNAQSNPLKSNETSRFRLESGQVLLRVAKKMVPNSRFEIETPNVVVALRSAVLNVAIDKGATQIQVLQGRAEVSDLNTARQISVRSGQQMRAAMLQLKIVSTANNTGANPGAAADNPDYQTQLAFSKPEIQVSARLLSPDFVLLSGHTEAGNRVTIDGARVPVLGTGDFVRRVKGGPHAKGWKIESTDQFGVTSSIYQSPPLACDAEK